MLWVTSCFVIPGWLFTLPLVLAVRSVSKHSLWLLGIGCIAAGPLIILICAIIDHFNWSILFFNVYALPTSAIATSVYLWLIVKHSTGNKWQIIGVSSPER